jgi:hypothetical protein
MPDHLIDQIRRAGRWTLAGERRDGIVQDWRVAVIPSDRLNRTAVLHFLLLKPLYGPSPVHHWFWCFAIGNLSCSLEAVALCDERIDVAYTGQYVSN